MLSLLVPVVAIVGLIFFAGLALRLGLGLIRALFALLFWPLRGLLSALGVLPERD